MPIQSEKSVAQGSDLRYPVGKFKKPGSATPDERSSWIQEIETLPRDLKQAINGMSEEQLDTPYRPEGWTVRQLVHHLPDSHLNSYQRFRLALTEENPAIKAYEEAKWAELPDARTGPIEPSLRLLEGLHQRWVLLLRSMDDAQFARTFRHPDLGEMDLGSTLAMYAWHCRHHLAHITGLRDRAGW